jgi:hypothetical protein
MGLIGQGGTAEAGVQSPREDGPVPHPRAAGAVVAEVLIAAAVATLLLYLKRRRQKAFAEIDWLFDAGNVLTVETILLQIMALALPKIGWVEDALAGTVGLIIIVYIYLAGSISWNMIKGVL